MHKLFPLPLTKLSQWRYRGILVATLLATVVLGVGVLSFAPAAHAASRVQTSSASRSAGVLPAIIDGCPEGSACFYKGGNPALELGCCGTHILVNWVGEHLVVNDLTGGTVLWLCTDLSGNICPIKLAEDQSELVDLTPINSVKITLH